MENTRYKILFVEDNELDRMAFGRFVKDNAIPYDCTIAECAAQAQSTLRSDQFDVIISDHALGDGTAFDILNMAKNTPVVVVTGAGDEETAIKVWKAGAYDYLIKDLDQNYLKAIPITVQNAIEHKIIERELRLLSGAVMSTDDSVYITDMLDKIIFVNKAFCETYGYDEQDIIGKSSSILWIGKNQCRNTRSVFETRTVGSTWEVGFYHRRKDDSVFPVSLSRSTIKDSTGEEIAVVGIARDISQRIVLEDEIRTTNLNLKKKNQLQNEMAITVAETLQRLLAEGNIDGVERVIANYHDISEINAGKLRLRRQQFSFTAAVSQVVEALLPIATEKSLELTSSMPDHELVINGDYDRIIQVLTELLRRATRLSSANGHVNLQVEDTGDQLAIQIEDDSAPLERNEIHRIVNSPDWIREQCRAGREDLALGLWIAKELLGMHGGRIWAESSGDRKNTFCIALPKSAVQREVSTSVGSANMN
jgi:PAS domain S-box-containing protein